MSGKNKKKKNKVKYIDDGRTVADMSGVGGSRKNRPPSGLREQWKTYKNSVKMMFVPMLVTLAGITVIFGIIYLILTLAE